MEVYIDELEDANDAFDYINENALDVEFKDSDYGTYRGAIITLTYGGPTVTFDTWNGCVEYYDGNEYEYDYVSKNVADMFDEACRELFFESKDRE